MFEIDGENFSHLANFNLRYAVFLVSVFIADYINLFPSALKVFESLKTQEQIAINLLNVTVRDIGYSINDKWKECE